MSIIKLQGEQEKLEGLYYEFDNGQKPLGEGGMGKVYRGRQVNIFTGATRDVAIKFMFAGLQPNVIKRAEDEANIRIHNDNLIEMMGFLTTEDKTPNGAIALRYHVVSELLIGVSLSDLMQGVVTDQNGNPMPYAQNLYKLYTTSPEQFAVTVIKKVLSGIMALHDAGYIHRDIDPSNIMITRDEKIKLIDFGIAKKVDGLKTHDRNLTTAGQFMGKPQYAAPELIIGDLKNQNKPTDIYAIGVLLFQLITGHLPFDGPSNVVLNAHLHNKMPLKQIQDSHLRKVLDRATDKDCTKRYQSAAEFRAELDSYSSSNGKGKSISLQHFLYGGIGLAVIIAAIVCIVVFWKKDPKPDTPDKVVTEQIEEVSSSDLSVNDIRRKLLNPTTAKDAFTALLQKCDDRDKDARFILSRIYAVSSGPFTLNDDFVKMQANLKDIASPDPVKAHEVLKEIVDDNPEYYPALYELACDYYEGKPLSGNEELNLRKAKGLLDKAYEAADKADDVVYVNKISSLLRRY